jgi:putative PIN family toxin of toxin-antitoxin system
MNPRLHVVDTNVLISAVLQPSGTTAKVLTKIRAAGGLLVFSDDTFAELATRIMRPKFDRYVETADREMFLSELAAVGRFVAIEGNLRACRDPEDDRILETAVRSEASWIVTGDRDLLVLHPFRGIDILSPGDFLLAAAIVALRP